MSMSPEGIKAKKEWGFTFTKNAENPVLLEFENFDGTKKVSSPSFLMAMFLRQHLKAIEKKVGEKPKEIALWIFEEGFNEIQMKRIKDGLGEACKLLKLGFTFVDAKDFTANFVQTRTISLID
uniref:Uncharacterized protein n=1 Tax=Panagrolaimus davidi TaxID=227884 RepID=A0A914PCI1_9BILA